MNQPFRRRGAEHEPAFEALFREHFAELCAFAYRYVRSRAVAEEIVQDVFLRIWERRDEKDVAVIRRAYLYRAVRNEALKQVDRARTEEKWERRGLLAVEPTMPAAPESRALARAAAVDRAVDTLPPRCKAIFLAVRIDGLRYAEVARMLGISPKTVEAQMVRAVKLLRERLGDSLPD